MNAFRSEMIKLRAHRTTWWLLPLVFVAMTSVATLALLASVDAMSRGASRAEQLSLVAVAPSSGTFFSGLAVAIFSIILVTTDTSTGVINLSLAVTSRRAMLQAKAAVVVIIAVLASVVGVVGVGLASVVILPRDLLFAAVASPLVWVNVIGVVATHVTWATLGMFVGWAFRRSAPALGVLLGVMLLPPAIAAGLRSMELSRVASVVELLPAGLMQAATVTTADALTTVAPVPASLGLVAWSALFVLASWPGVRPVR